MLVLWACWRVQIYINPSLGEQLRFARLGKLSMSLDSRFRSLLSVGGKLFVQIVYF